MDILVSGASIAGPTVAYWLAKAGHRVTVIERAESLRTAGQNIDVRGSGREVLRRMNLEAAGGVTTRTGAGGAVHRARDSSRRTAPLSGVDVLTKQKLPHAWRAGVL